jgi:hypothetical protein
LTPTQLLLIAASLRKEAEARHAWDEVRLRLDLDRLEPGSFALMPTLYRRLEQWQLDDPALPRLKGLYRHSWYRNQMLLVELSRIVSSLEAADVRFVVGGGALLMAGFYDEPGLRPTDRIDVIVDPRQLSRARAALASLNWRVLDEGASRTRTAHWFGLGDDRFAVLRAPLFPATIPVWQHAEPVRSSDATFPGLDAGHQLLWTCLGVDRHELWGRVQWIADADVLIGSRRVDWERFAAEAAALRSTRAVRRALTTVDEVAGSAPPDTALAELARAPVGARERLADRLSRSAVPPRVVRRLARLPRSL